MDRRTTYILDPETIYKGVGLVNPGQEISFDTNASGASCGISLNLVSEHLVGLHHNGDGSFSANTCGLLSDWQFVTEEDNRSLETGCEEEDPCYGQCGEFQVQKK